MLSHADENNVLEMGSLAMLNFKEEFCLVLEIAQGQRTQCQDLSWTFKSNCSFKELSKVIDYKAIENKVEIHDLHATMLHLLGIDHTKSTFRFSSRDMCLTDVHGHIIKEILA